MDHRGATDRLGTPVLGVAGVANWKSALGYVERLRPAEVIVAFDQDQDPATRAAVVENARALAQSLEGRGLRGERRGRGRRGWMMRWWRGIRFTLLEAAVSHWDLSNDSPVKLGGKCRGRAKNRNQRALNAADQPALLHQEMGR